MVVEAVAHSSKRRKQQFGEDLEALDEESPAVVGMAEKTEWMIMMMLR